MDVSITGFVRISDHDCISIFTWRKYFNGIITNWLSWLVFIYIKNYISTSIQAIIKGVS
jgi:hypothetical protein